MDKKSSGSWFEVVKTLFWAFILAAVFRTFAFDPYHIPSGSMLPNLLIGDFVVVSKYSYGYSKYSSWPIPIDVFDGRIMESMPERGDVAVFRVPGNPPGKEIYIKRIMGLPGDLVQMRSGKLFINGEQVQTKGHINYEAAGRKFQSDIEILESGRQYIVLNEDSGFYLDNTPVFKVPDDSVFVIGDNRDNSEDSRAGLGPVKIEHLIGRAEIVLFSSEGMIWDVTSWRSNRFFVGLD